MIIYLYLNVQQDEYNTIVLTKTNNTFLEILSKILLHVILNKVTGINQILLLLLYFLGILLK